MSFNQFPDYQSLEPGTQGAPGKANRSIPQRVEEYKLLEFVTPESDVLDIGCNRGYFGVFLSPYIKSYTGVDSDENQIKAGLDKKPHNSELIVGTFKKLERKFDVILCLSVHSYLSEDMDVLAQDLMSMMKDDGYLFIEGHPPGYREEPWKYLFPLVSKLKKYLSWIYETTVKDRDLTRQLYIFHKGQSGVTSIVNIDGDTATKTYFKWIDNADSIFRAEAMALAMLNGRPHFPTLKSIDYVNRVIVMNYCGERLTKENIPSDWGHQCFIINSIFDQMGIYNLDVKMENILVKDGIIHLVDFGFWSTDKSRYEKNITNVIKEYA